MAAQRQRQNLSIDSIWEGKNGRNNNSWNINQPSWKLWYLHSSFGLNRHFLSFLSFVIPSSRQGNAWWEDEQEQTTVDYWQLLRTDLINNHHQQLTTAAIISQKRKHLTFHQRRSQSHFRQGQDGDPLLILFLKSPSTRRPPWPPWEWSRVTKSVGTITIGKGASSDGSSSSMASPRWPPSPRATWVVDTIAIGEGRWASNGWHRGEWVFGSRQQSDWITSASFWQCRIHTTNISGW